IRRLCRARPVVWPIRGVIFLAAIPSHMTELLHVFHFLRATTTSRNSTLHHPLCSPGTSRFNGRYPETFSYRPAIWEASPHISGSWEISIERFTFLAPQLTVSAPQVVSCCGPRARRVPRPRIQMLGVDCFWKIHKRDSTTETWRPEKTRV